MVLNLFGEHIRQPREPPNMYDVDVSGERVLDGVGVHRVPVRRELDAARMRAATSCMNVC